LFLYAAIFGVLEPVQDEEIWRLQSGEGTERVAAWKTVGM